jgi:hypothetical protein
VDGLTLTIKRIDPNENNRYAFLIQSARTPFDGMFHLICLRVLFTNDDTGERFVHYIVFAPYKGGIDSTLHPEDASVSSAVGTGSRSYQVTRSIKQDARILYGNEYREYHAY